MFFRENEEDDENGREAKQRVLFIKPLINDNDERHNSPRTKSYIALKEHLI